MTKAQRWLGKKKKTPDMYSRMEEYYLHEKYILTDRTIVQSQAPEPISNSEAKRRHAPLVPR